ncbi:MAG: RNA polymerase sigma factor [Candidatus Sericytochromatia bacterium]
MATDEQGDQRALLRAAQAGDKAAFEKLLSPHLPKLYNLAYHMVQHRDDAQDAVQDTAIKAFRSLKGFREEANFSTWLARILRNTILDEVKRAVRRHEEATEVLPERAEHQTEPGMEQRELRDLMMGFLGQLSDKLREP